MKPAVVTVKKHKSNNLALDLGDLNEMTINGKSREPKLEEQIPELSRKKVKNNNRQNCDNQTGTLSFI